MKIERQVVINGSDTITFIPFANILYFQADGNYCEVFMNDGKSIVWCKRIGDILRELKDSGFIKISQSIILNKGYIKHVHKKRKEIELADGKLLPYSILQRDFLELLLA